MKSKGRTYEPLTSENAALILVDHQIGLMTGVRDYPIACSSTMWWRWPKQRSS
jgi:hypothetical protein